MSKVRIYEVAKQLNLDPKAVVGLFQAIGLTDVRNHMSSVDPEAVERVKRHLEKQRTHDVVEERIRPTVVKRRAIAKPDGGPASVPTPSTSSPELTDVASRRDLSQLVPERVSSPRLDTDVMAKDRESTRMLALEAEAKKSSPRLEAPASSPALPPAAEERKSSRTLKADKADKTDKTEAKPEVKAEALAPEPPPVVQAPPPPASVREVASAPRIEAPPAPPSVREVREVREVPGAAVEVAPPPPSAPALPVEAAPASVAAAAPSTREVTPLPAGPNRVSPSPAPAMAPPVEEPPPPVRQPKTGIEVWGGRPGVPMPTPAGVQRTGIGGGAPGAMPRRVQYDPRAGTGAGRGPMRPGGPGGRGPMMGRGGPGGARGRMGGPQIPRKPPAVSTQEMSAHKKVIRIEENITLASMAAKMSLKATELLMKLLSMGMTGVHINTSLDADTAKILASEFGWEVEDVAISEEESIAAARGEESASAEKEEIVDPNLILRPPVVTVMGHVDHGKTSLLDRIRKTDVAAGEAGGITQHIGAYKVNTKTGTIVFLDTPGHEAFTAMRARGASVTDVIVLVVAADDGVMPQTKEAIAHAKAAKVPIIVAVNKVDKPSAEPERVRRELVEQGLQPEEWGGDTIFVNVSAHTGTGIDQLLEMIALQAEVLDLKANPKKPAAGVVLEALLDRGRGPVARVLIQEGTLKVGDYVLAGAGFGKVRAMTNEHGKQVHEAPPSTPVEILGLSDVPSAGDQLHAVKDAEKARVIAESRKGKQKQNLIPTDQRMSLEGLERQLKENEQLELRIIIKGDVQGSIEAVSQALTRLSTDRVRLSVIHAGVGAITEGDVNLAIASRAIIVGFNVRPAGKAASLAEENKIEIRLYSIIYNAVDDVKGAMEGLLPANLVEKQIGKAEVRQIFKIRGLVIAGSYVIQGTVKRTANARLVRDNVVVWSGKLAGLKRIKDDAKEVAEGFECGISLEGYTDIKEKDVVECYEIEEVKQKL